MRSVGRALGVCLSVMLFGARASAQAPLLGGLGGDRGFGVNSVDYNDDNSSGSIDLTPAFPGGICIFRSTLFRTFYVNNNGNISFEGPLGTFTPQAFPVANQPMIAPWWGDVDTRGGGRPDHNGVYWDVRPGQVAVTWYRVGVFSQNDRSPNSFQLLLRSCPGCAAGDFDVEFRYNLCQWTAGSASGGDGLSGRCPPGSVGSGCFPAQAGFDSGNGRDSYTLPTSNTEDVLSLCRTSNVGEPGRWVFFLRGCSLSDAGVVQPDPTGRIVGDAGPCSGYACLPPELRLQGTAGPIGCQCSATPGAPRARSPWRAALGLAAAALVLTRRRREARA